MDKLDNLVASIESVNVIIESEVKLKFNGKLKDWKLFLKTLKDSIDKYSENVNDSVEVTVLPIEPKIIISKENIKLKVRG